MEVLYKNGSVDNNAAACRFSTLNFATNWLVINIRAPQDGTFRNGTVLVLRRPPGQRPGQGIGRGRGRQLLILIGRGRWGRGWQGRRRSVEVWSYHMIHMFQCVNIRNIILSHDVHPKVRKIFGKPNFEQLKWLSFSVGLTRNVNALETCHNKGE